VKTTLTERGQVSIPAALRDELRLEPGQTLIWEKVSPTECRVLIQAKTLPPANPHAAVGFAERMGLPVRPSADWMRELREGEE